MTPTRPDFLLSSPHPSVIPLTEKKRDAIKRMLPHIPGKHHSFYESLLSLKDDSAETASETPKARGIEKSQHDDARKKRILEDDSFLSNFDQFLPVEAQKDLENANE